MMAARILVVAVLAVGVFGTPTKKEIGILFSGGGVRATFGTLVAACEIQKVGGVGAGISVNQIAGLSGGAWGVTMLGMSMDERRTQIDPCQKIKDIQTAGTWGDFGQTFHNVKCERLDSIDGTVRSCFKEWRQSIISKLFDDKSPDDLSFIGVKSVKADKAVIITNMCSVADGEVATRHTGTCAISPGAQEVHCREFETGRRIDFGVEAARLRRSEDDPFMGTADVYDWLASSSAAWAEAGKSSRFIKGKVPPLFEAEATSERDKGRLTTRFCDSGGECNLPLSYIDTISQPELHRISGFVAFDFSDNGGNMKKSIEQCKEAWTREMKWEVQSEDYDKPWGATITVNRKSRTESRAIPIHVVYFKGVKSGTDLVKSIPTMNGLLTGYAPASLDKKKIDLMIEDYGKFVQSIVTPSSNQNVFSAAANPPPQTTPQRFRGLQRKLSASKNIQRMLESE